MYEIEFYYDKNGRSDIVDMLDNLKKRSATSKNDRINREKINFEIDLIGKLIEAREQKGLSQRELAELSGVKQPAIARLESMKTTPQIDTLFKILNPLGYTLSIVPLKSDAIDNRI